MFGLPNCGKQLEEGNVAAQEAIASLTVSSPLLPMMKATEGEKLILKFWLSMANDTPVPLKRIVSVVEP